MVVVYVYVHSHVKLKSSFYSVHIVTMLKLHLGSNDSPSVDFSYYNIFVSVIIPQLKSHLHSAHSSHSKPDATRLKPNKI